MRKRRVGINEFVDEFGNVRKLNNVKIRKFDNTAESSWVKFFSALFGLLAFIIWNILKFAWNGFIYLISLAVKKWKMKNEVRR